MPLIQIEHVTYRYPGRNWPALADLSLQVEEGEFVLLTGANGSGKSTLLRLLNGLIPQFHGGELTGHVAVGGLETRTTRVHQFLPWVGLVFQNPKAQLFASTVERELTFGLESLGLARQEMGARVAWAADHTRVTHLLNRAPQTLSGGEQQRVAIAAILALRPRLLAFDEPLAGLDPVGEQELGELLNTLHGEGVTLLVAEQRLAGLLSSATRLVALAGGSVVVDGPPRSRMADLAVLEIRLPPLVELARASGSEATPLTVEEALAAGLTAPTQVVREPPAPGAEIVIEARSVGFRFQRGRGGPAAAAGPQIALHGVSFTIRRGERVAVVGRNGSGKTTLLKLLNGLRKPTEGEALILGRDTRELRASELAAEVGLIFQNPDDQFFAASVREEIAVGPRALGVYEAGALEPLFDLFRLRPLLDRPPFRLSEGEKKRVATASALAVRPKIVLLDEPTVGQDAPGRAALTQWMGESSQTVVMATHDLEFAEEVAPRWLVVADGELLADGAPEAIMSDARLMRRAGLVPTTMFELASRRRSAG